MITVICYLCTAALNLFWLSKGDEMAVSAQMALPIVSVFIAGIGVLLRCRVLRPAQRSRYARQALWVLGLYYVAIASALLLFGGLFQLHREWGGAVNLEPFYTIRRYIIHYRRTGSLASFSNLLGNVIVLMPLGVLLPMLFRPLRRFWLTLPLLALIAAGVEWLQWRTGSGVADVDDSILNFAGAAVGYILTRLCQLIWLRIKGR